MSQICDRIVPGSTGERCGAPAAGSFAYMGRYGLMAESHRCAGCWPEGAGPVPTTEESSE